jgi:hypothetical protein
MIHHDNTHRNALVIAIAAAAVFVGTALIAQQDFTGARARTAAEHAQQLAKGHEESCARLGHGDRTTGRANCLQEMNRLKQWHENFIAAQNESLL